MEKFSIEMKMKMDPEKIIFFFYPEDTPLRRLLIAHSVQVRDKACSFLAHCPEADPELVKTGAMLHDIGIGKCHAPGILCMGTEPYLAHGIAGGCMLRAYGSKHGLDMEPYARICERHTGTGLTAKEIREQGLPLPEKDFLPETLEEKLICFADKFFSKSGDMLEKSPERIRRSLEKFGSDTVERWDSFCRLFMN